MKIVIDIPEEDYNDICNSQTASNYSVLEALDGIRNGMPLPKGHGDLKDVAEIERLWQKGDYDSLVSAVIFATTVIEADKAESEGRDERKTEK